MLAVSLAACRPSAPAPRTTVAPSEVDRWLRGMEAMEVRAADEKVLRRVTDPTAMRAFLSLLPSSEFDDIFGESGNAEYFVKFIGPGYSDYYVAFSKTHVRYIPKGAAKLRPGERAEILGALGVQVQ